MNSAFQLKPQRFAANDAIGRPTASGRILEASLRVQEFKFQKVKTNQFRQETINFPVIRQVRDSHHRQSHIPVHDDYVSMIAVRTRYQLRPGNEGEK